MSNYEKNQSLNTEKLTFELTTQAFRSRTMSLKHHYGTLRSVPCIFCVLVVVVELQDAAAARIKQNLYSKQNLAKHKCDQSPRSPGHVTNECALLCSSMDHCRAYHVDEHGACCLIRQLDCTIAGPFATMVKGRLAP